MLWVKLLVLGLLVAVVIALFRALTAMMRGEGAQGKTVRALAWRVGLSASVFLFLLLAMYMGWVEPHDVNPAKRHGQPVETGEEAPPGQATP